MNYVMLLQHPICYNLVHSSNAMSFSANTHHVEHSSSHPLHPLLLVPNLITFSVSFYIKAENVLLVSHSDDFTIKLTDFGLAKSLGDGAAPAKTFCGTVR